MTKCAFPVDKYTSVEVDVSFRRFGWVALVALPLALNVGCSSSDSENGGSAGSGGSGGSGAIGGDGGGGGAEAAPYAANVCAGAKQAAAGTYCKAVSEAWAAWAGDQDDSARDAAIDVASTEFEDSWREAQAAADEEGADCSTHAWPADEAAREIASGLSALRESVNDGLDLGEQDQATCSGSILTAVGDLCDAALDAQGAHVSDLHADPDGEALEQATEAAVQTFSSAWTDATSGTCPTNATEDSVLDDLEGVVVLAVTNTIVTPGLTSEDFLAVEPGETEYLGRTYDPQCMQGDQYRFFAKRGSVNKVVMYYQGGGACWNNLTCAGVEGVVPQTCRVSPYDELPQFAGFGDLTNENNPFRDWHWVFVSYCTCDIHFGDATVEYPGFEPITVQHLGYHNSKVAERWAREHFLNPEEVFVTGSSAGAYGAWFNGPLLHDVWPASQIHVLADAGNGVITDDFLQNEFGNWNFVANLPDIPGVAESITDGSGMPGYTEAVASYFPETNWAHYSTLFDGGSGGQTGFYNLMLEGGDPSAALSWWNGSCGFGENALSQSLDIYDAVPENYRYYFGTGSAHTMWGRNKVYDNTVGGVPTVVSWLNAMLASGPDGRNPDWTNVLCDDCGLTLPGDPAPNPLEAPFEMRGADTVIVCEE